MNENVENCPLNVFELLPNIKKCRGQKVLVKYGGNAMVDDAIKSNVVKDIVFLKLIGMKPVIVHGGGPAISEHMKRVGLKPTFVDGQRKTDAETLEIVEMVLCGKVNNELIKLINFEGVKAIGLSGKDVGLIEARRHRREIEKDGRMKMIDIGQVGEVVKIDTEIIDIVTEHEIIPVIAPIGVGKNNEDYNINADVLAGEIASAVGAENLIYLTDVDGILENPEHDGSRIGNLDVTRAKSLVGTTIQGGMIPKVESCIEAVERGLESAYVINGTTPHSLLVALLMEQEIGTRIHAEK
jgi:acetylglutamate kinase